MGEERRKKPKRKKPKKESKTLTVFQVGGDFIRGNPNKEITIRFDGNDLVRLTCFSDYDPALRGEDKNNVMVVRKIEVQKPDGTWDLYPSVTWLDGVEHGDQLQTRVLVKKTNEDGFNIMSSTDGVPDGELICAAKATGVYTESIG